MSVTELVPGMRPGSTVRNAAVVVVYLFFIYLWPLIAAVVIGTNRHGAADKLSRLPGVSEGGGAISALVAFAGTTVIITIVLGLLGAGGNEGDTAPDSPDAGTSGDTSGSTDAAGDREENTVATDGGTESEAMTETDTPTPTETATGTPTETATETPTETATPEPAEDGASYSFSDEGNDVTDSFTTEGGLVTIAFEHDGESNFQVQAVRSDGEQKHLVNEIGTYDGEVALYLPSSDWNLEVTADGSWSADIEQPRFNDQDIKNLPAEASGEHAAWFGPFEFEGTTEVTFEITDDSQASVWLADHHGQNVDLLHNEIGPYEGTALVTNEGVGLIIVDTDSAEWRIEIGG